MGRCKYTYNDVKNDIEKEGYTLFSKEEDYVNTNSYLLVQCPHGHEPYKVKYTKWRDGRRCPVCGGKKKLTQEQARERFAQQGFKMIGEFVACRYPVEVECEHGHRYKRRLDADYGCPYCYGNKPLTIEQIRERIECHEGFKLLSDTYGRKSKLDIQCPKGHIFAMRLDGFEGRCPCCAESKGEQRVREWLEKEGIEFNTQKQFDGCNYKGRLRFDFYIPSMNLCIEYDGMQHFKPTDFTSKMSEKEVFEQFEIIKKRDEIKNKYCEEHNINLLRIPYWDFENVENILKSQLK